MRLADSFIGKDGRSISPYISNSKVIEIIEITSNVEIPKKLDELRRSLSKQSINYMILVLKRS